MSESRLYLGIDFGTSNSSVSYVYHDPRYADTKCIDAKVLQVAVDDEGIVSTGRVPTVLSAHFDDTESNKTLFGWEFSRQLRRGKQHATLLRRGVDFFESVKSDLGSFKIYPRSFSKEYNTPEKVTTAVIQYLLREARSKLSQHDIQNSHVVVTVPASLNAEVRRQTKEAAEQAGLRPDRIELIDEPIAALLHLLNDPSAVRILEEGKRKKLLVFDYGGGTLDLCLVQAGYDLSTASGLVAENLAISRYRRNGGNDVDQAVMRQVVWPQIEKKLNRLRNDLPVDLRKRIEDTFTCTSARRLKEKISVRISREIADGATWTELAQKNISATESMERDFHDNRLPDVIHPMFEITYKQFDEIMAPFLLMPPEDYSLWDQNYSHSLVVPILETVAKANIDPAAVDALILHGGSCRNPYVRTRLREVLSSGEGPFGDMDVIETPDLDTSVACGAALACYWKHARGEEIIAPIIAEELGVMTLGDQPVCLVKACEPLPYPDENALEENGPFYAPREGLRQLLVPFYVGSEAMRRISGTIRIDLPAGVKRGDIVKIKLQVDCDKVVHWWYNINGGDFSKAQSLENPWVNARMSPRTRQLVDYRLRMRKELSSKGHLPKVMEIGEAVRLYDCGNLDEAELSLLDYLSHHGEDAECANMLSLVYGVRGSREQEMHYAKLAASLSPESAVYAGNYGVSLARMGRAEEAVASFRRAIDLDPTVAYVYEHLGNFYRKEGKEDAAEREYRQAVRLAEKSVGAMPDSTAGWRNSERLYRKLGEYDKAEEAQRHFVNAQMDEVYGGDHRMCIAGPDSGF